MSRSKPHESVQVRWLKHRAIRMFTSCCLIGALSAIFSPAALAEIILPHMFSDHAVLQRGRPIHIWGAAAAGEKLRLTFNRQVTLVEASDLGFWETNLKPEKAGGPFTLLVESLSTKEQVRRSDILVGDVWFASGQSNMEMPLEGFPKSSSPVNGGDEEITKAAHYPKLRLLLQSRRTSIAPQWDTEDRWTVSSPESARRFSAVAYSFGLDLLKKNDVPVGLIAATWGGTPAHSWISAEGIGWAGLSSVAVDAGIVARQQSVVDRIRANAQVDAQEVARINPQLRSHAHSWIPSTLYNGMVAPYAGYTLAGWLWYQGETDANEFRPPHYSRVFPALIQDWRKQWGQGDLPFLYVQLASFARGNSEWGRVRDAQRRAEALTNTAMVVALDLGARDNIHPPEKFTLGHRLSGLTYSMSNGWLGREGRSPAFVRASSEGSQIRAWFENAKALRGSSPTIGDFEVAGDDHVFVPAAARIETIDGQTTVIADAPGVKAPKFLRYGWKPYVESYLYNGAGLPLGSFTSESDTQIGAP